MFEVWATTYAGVFMAEIVGDKLLYTSGVLVTRYPWGAVILGMSAAFMAKMAVAVAIGATIGELLPKWLIAALTALSFIGVALAMWRKPDVRAPKDKDKRVLNGASVAFLTIFLSEWGDKGMITAGTWSATWVASSAHPGSGRATTALVVWLAAVLAMVTKGGLAVTLGQTVRHWIATRVEPRYVRYAAVGAMIVLGLLAVLEVLGIVAD